jgi:pectate lyase
MRSYRFPQFFIAKLLVFVAFGFIAASYIQAEQIVYFPLDTDPGWTTQGQWAFGVPTGGGSYCYDPTSGHTGNNVYGYNLNGDYSNNMPQYCLTSTPIDCSNYENVTLTFWRWLGVESSYFDYASVEVSNNGIAWTTIWENPTNSLCDGSWVQCTYNISAIADFQPTVYIRWTMGPTDFSETYSGWNIDDISLTGDVAELIVTPSQEFASSGFEGGTFTPAGKNYTLTNNSPNSLDWTAEANVPWLDVSPDSGTLQPTQSVEVAVSINADANSLAAGDYNTEVIFTNLTSSVERQRPVALAVREFKNILPDGFGANATGGAGGTVVTVDNANDLEYYAEMGTTPYIIQVLGTIDITGLSKLGVTSNKTIKGIGPNPTIIGNIRFLSGSSNIIIEGLNITNPNNHDQGDGITVKDNITNLFITKCNIYDCADGAIDITNESDYVTVSWCKFYYVSLSSHRYVNLIGADDAAYGDRGKLHVTSHHNWWGDKCDQRMPRVRFGQVHVYNNYYSCADSSYCGGAALESQLLFENNYFDNTPFPYYIFDYSYPEIILGKISASGNIFNNCLWWDDGDDDVFEPNYSYVLDNGEDVKAIVMAGAGNVGTDITPPSAPVGLTVTAGYIPVVLDWNDNTESDLQGYNVYRSTTSGSGYDKLNSTPLTDSNYIDEISTTDITYYYVVKAVDTSFNESVNSNEVYSGLYGDFTGNGIVSMSDLAEFLIYWLLDDCEETAGVDLDSDCRVNFDEFSAFAENWMQQ